ncbi:hypothetical protein BH09PSE4_BH09PSE4_16550 [soil metagenome]
MARHGNEAQERPIAEQQGDDDTGNRGRAQMTSPVLAAPCRERHESGGHAVAEPEAWEDAEEAQMCHVRIDQ